MKTVLSTTNLIACAVIAGAFALGFASGPATAQDPIGRPEPFKFDFAYDVAEVTNVSGAEGLLTRLQGEVKLYCGYNVRMTLNERKFVQKCIDSTMEQAVSKFGNATLAQAYRSRADG